MNVLALASYPVEAAATRYRLTQFVAPLAERGIALDIRPFVNSQLFASLYRREELPRTAFGLMKSALKRLTDVTAAGAADVLYVQREAMMFGPPLVEWLAANVVRCPLVLDLDDATYVPYISPTYGRLGSALKWFRKTDDLIRWAKIVTCGNRSIAEYVAKKGRPSVVIPTVVDTELFCPKLTPRESDVPVLGWIGTHSTYPYLESIFPALQQLARKHRFRVKVIGAGRDDINVPGVDVENLKWNLLREVDDFQSFDIGLYPIIPDAWSVGKSGFKAIQYMAVGIPYVVTPVGACAETGELGQTHFDASSPDEWRDRIAALLSNPDLRKNMGEAGRQHALQNYTVPMQADKLARALRGAVSSGSSAA